MRKIQFFKALLALLVIGYGGVASAQITILTGVEDEAYDLMGLDILKHAENSDKIKLVPTNGAKSNVEGLKPGQLAFTQYDVLQKALLNDLTENTNVTDSIRLLLPVGRTEVHLIARTTKRKISYLADLNSPDVKVAVGTKDQATYTTVQVIKQLTQSNWTDVELPLAESIQALLNNEIDALFYVGCAPVPQFSVFSKLAAHEKSTIKLIPIEHLKVKETYDGGKIIGGTYKWAGSNIETVVTKTLLVANVTNETAEQSDLYFDLLKEIRKKILRMQGVGARSPQWKQTNFIFTGIEWDRHGKAEEMFFPSKKADDDEKEGDE